MSGTGVSGHKSSGRLGRALRSTMTAIAIGYPATLLVIAGSLRWMSEAWWVTGVALYLPQAGFALPLPFIVLALAWARRFRLLTLQGVSLLLILFPLMGLNLSWRSSPAPGEPSFRILTYNVNSANDGFREVAEEIKRHAPDIVVLQELPHWRADGVRAELSPGFPHIEAHDQFMVASKRPILSSEMPPRIPFFGKERSPRYMRFVLETSLGPVTLINIHTVSPRGGFSQLRGQGFKREILSGRVLNGAAAAEIEGTAALRALQVRAAADMARRETGPVLIVGDTNLPTQSAIRRRYLGDFHDGFAEAGLGFGYTYPAKLPFLRIDLLLSNDALAFERVEVGGSRASDHLCVFGDVVRRR